MDPLTNSAEIKNFLHATQFISGSYQLYEGLAGFEDYGINGFPIKRNLLDCWRFIMLGPDIYEVETPQITPYPILKASGHADRFFDYVITDLDMKTHRADHLVKAHLKSSASTLNVDEMSPSQLEQYIKEHKLVPLSPDTKITTKCLSFTVDADFLRPELAQGIFVNMKQYLDYFSRELPFGIAQTGKSFRREVSPEPFIRLREFSQAEIEYFFDPNNVHHPQYDKIKNKRLPLLTAKNQESKTDMSEITIESAVDTQIICNEIMAYFLAKVYELAIYIGLHPKKIRFRQHLSNEMSHYAIQCWDLECLLFEDNSWLECVGIAHRGSHDLSAHNIKDAFTMKGKTFTNQIKKSLNVPELKAMGLDYIEILKFQKDHSVEEIIEKYKLTEKCIKVSENKVWDTFVPNVIEPSVGLDRLCYAMFVQNLYVRNEADNPLKKEENKRVVLRLPKCISRYDYAVFPLSNNKELIAIVMDIMSSLRNKRFRCFTDLGSINIGKRYIRADELGIPACITVDFASLEDQKVTVRDRDTMKQIRIAIDAVKGFG